MNTLMFPFTRGSDTSAASIPRVRSGVRRHVALGLSIALAVGASAVGAAPAGAYVHQWDPNSSPAACNNLPSDTRCYDNQGQTYNPWRSLSATSMAGRNLPELCVKAITSSNNLRSTTTGSSNDDYCVSNGGYRLINLIGATPESRGYVYWNWGSWYPWTNEDLRGRGNTDG